MELVCFKTPEFYQERLYIEEFYSASLVRLISWHFWQRSRHPHENTTTAFNFLKHMDREVLKLEINILLQEHSNVLLGYKLKDAFAAQPHRHTHCHHCML